MEVNGKNLNIQGGSPEDPGSLPEEAVQKEIEALAREAAARGIIEAARIEAGEALMKILEETPVKEKGAGRQRIRRRPIRQNCPMKAWPTTAG